MSNDGSTPEDEFVLLVRAPDLIEAAALKCALESEGIEVVQSGGQSSFGFGDLPRDALTVDLYVRAGQVEEARKLCGNLVDEEDGATDD